METTQKVTKDTTQDLRLNQCQNGVQEQQKKKKARIPQCST